MHYFVELTGKKLLNSICFMPFFVNTTTPPWQHIIVHVSFCRSTRVGLFVCFSPLHPQVDDRLNPCECEVSEMWHEKFSSRRMSHLGNQNTASSAAGSIRPYRCHTRLHMRWAYSDTVHFSKHTDNKESMTWKINVTKVCTVRSESQFDL